MSLQLGNLTGTLLRSGLSDNNFAAPPGGGGGGIIVIDPIPLAEAAGFGYYDMEAGSLSYVEGTGSGAGRVYQWLDRTPSTHMGTWSHADGGSSSQLPAIGTRVMENPYFTSPHWYTGPPPTLGITAPVYIMIFKLPGISAAPSSACRLWGGFQATLLADRPYFKLSNTASEWVYNSGQGGGSDITDGSEGTNRTFTDIGALFSGWNLYDEGYHCLLVHHDLAAGQGLLLEIDGARLRAPDLGTPPAHNDWYTVFGYQDFGFAGGPGSVFGGISNIGVDVAAWSMGIAAATTFEESRAIASAMMTVYGIPELAD